jgi:hypothetical protein
MPVSGQMGAMRKLPISQLKGVPSLPINQGCRTVSSKIAPYRASSFQVTDPNDARKH